MSGEERQTQLSAKQKMSLYLVTLFVAAFVYVVPHIPAEVWKFALWIPLVAIGGGLLVGALAVFMALRTGQKAMTGSWSWGKGAGAGAGTSQKGPVVVGSWEPDKEPVRGKKS